VIILLTWLHPILSYALNGLVYINDNYTLQKLLTVFTCNHTLLRNHPSVKQQLLHQFSFPPHLEHPWCESPLRTTALKKCCEACAENDSKKYLKYIFYMLYKCQSQWRIQIQIPYSWELICHSTPKISSQLAFILSSFPTHSSHSLTLHTILHTIPESGSGLWIDG